MHRAIIIPRCGEAAAEYGAVTTYKSLHVRNRFQPVAFLARCIRNVDVARNPRHDSNYLPTSIELMMQQQQQQQPQQQLRRRQPSGANDTTS
jgi:hypothetical protein